LILVGGKSASFLRNIFKREQVLSNINSNKFPVGFIPEKSLRYFYQTDKKSKKNNFLLIGLSFSFINLWQMLSTRAI